MKKLLLCTFLVIPTLFATAQSKIIYEYNKFLHLKGTVYTVATEESWSKMGNVNSNLLFINTATGASTVVDFPPGGRVGHVEQIKIDSLKINYVLVTANTVDIDNRKGIDWADPRQLLLYTPSGEKLKQLTEDTFYVASYAVNETTGTLIVSGYFDVNRNQKRDKTESGAMLLYDLTTLKMKQQL